MEFKAFVGPSYTLDSVKTGVEKCVNLYLEDNENQGTRSLVYTPGLSRLSVCGGGPSRGKYKASNDRSFTVSGNKLYEITNPEVPVERGTLVTSTGTVSMADNGAHLIAVDGTKGYTLKFSDNTFAQIADADFPAATYVCFIDQYLIVNDKNNANFYISALSDATDWDGLDFAAAEAYPDKLVKHFTFNRLLYLIGSQSIEVWFDSGDVNFPFSRVQGSYSEYGSNAPDSWQVVGGMVIGLAQDKDGVGQVVRLVNGAPQRISTHAVEYALGKSTNLSKATSWTYQIEGHTFYCLNSPGLVSTWCFDLSNGVWHERASNGDRHRAENHCMAGGKHVVGDYQNGNLYELSDAFYTDNETAILRHRRSPHVSKETKQITVSEFRVDVETGLITDVSEPTCEIRISRDGGHTFGNPTTHSLGKKGDYKKRVNRNRMGSGRDWVFDFQTTAQLPIVITSAYLDAQAGKH